MGNNSIDLVGQKFGRLTVIREQGRTKSGSMIWECQCSCEKKTVKNISSANLRRGHTTSCGCDYGGRGISICEVWMDKEFGFPNFYKWSLENGYSENLSIDRIDGSGNYEPNNCRWATRKVQQNNRRNTIQITSNGETKSVAEWA